MYITTSVCAQGNGPDSALIHYANGRYAQALVFFKRGFEKGDTFLTNYYYAACCATLSNQHDEAFKLLTKCIDMGFLDQGMVLRDKELAPLREDPRWQVLLSKFKEQENKILAMFSKVRNVKSTDLIPFKQEGVWGYLDKSTLKVVVKPAFNSLGFMGNCTELDYRDLCQIRINSKGDEIHVIYPENIVSSFGIATETGILTPDVEPRQVSSANGFKGFTLNRQDQIDTYSDIYNRYTGSGASNIEGPFKINGKYFAIAHKKNRSGIIDQDGNALPNFDFVHYILYRNGLATGNEHWFYFKDVANKSGFINERGEVKFYDMGINFFSPTSKFNYSVQRTRNEYTGVLDLQKMKWFIEPQPLPIVGIHFSYIGECNVPKSKSDVIEFYFLVRTDTEEYYIDKDMKAYKPM